MDQEQPNDRFDVDNDYEGGEWIGGEYFYRSKRQKRQQTKDDQLYGIFAGSSDEEDGGRRGGRRGERNKPDYSKPVAFISKGVTQPDKRPDEQQQEAAEPRAKNEGDAQARAGDEERPRGGLGLGASSSTAGLGAGGGIGFAGLGSSTAGLGAAGGGAGGGVGGIGFHAASGAGLGVGQGEEEEEEDIFGVPTAFGKRIRQAAEEKRRASEREAKSKRKSGKAAKGGAGGEATDIGAFENHTKGVASRMMAKMGYVPGKGLGREQQGIARPIDNKLRPKNMGLGFNDFKEHKMIKPEEEEEEAAKAKAAAAPAAKAKQGGGKMWRKKAAAVRQQRVYKTAEELVQEAADKAAAAIAAGGSGAAAAAVVTQTIIDMRGPQARVVTNLEHLEMETESGPGGEAVPMPELQHNLKLLVDLAEAEIQRLDAKLRHEKDSTVLLGREQQRLREQVEVQWGEQQRMADLVAEVERCQAANDSATLQDLEAAYSRLRATYREEYVLYGLPASALAQALPRFLAMVADWDPLTHPEQHAGTFREWRRLLQASDRATLDASSDAYTTLCSEAVLPALRRVVVNDWDPKDPGPMERFMEAWEDVLPRPVLRYVSESLVLPRLRVAVGAWDPLRDTVALHVWLHPWLPYLGEEMAELWPAVRFKFANALQAWQPWDASAHAILAPWHRVFAPRDWEALLARSISPKLASALQQLVVNPAAQQMEAFHWVTAWADVMPTSMLAALLDAHFFPQWHAVLRHWLGHSPDYDEVTRWYLGWKAALPQDVLDCERLRQHLNAALNAMNAAMDGRPVPPAPAPAAPAAMPHMGMAARPAAAAAAAAAAAVGAYPATAGPGSGVPVPAWAQQQAAASGDLSLRSLVEGFAADNDLALLPKPGRTHGGLQVYGFGPVSIVMDAASNAITAQFGERWVPVSLEALLAEAANRTARASAAQQQRGR